MPDVETGWADVVLKHVWDPEWPNLITGIFESHEASPSFGVPQSSETDTSRCFPLVSFHSLTSSPREPVMVSADNRKKLPEITPPPDVFVVDAVVMVGVVVIVGIGVSSSIQRAQFCDKNSRLNIRTEQSDQAIRCGP